MRKRHRPAKFLLLAHIRRSMRVLRATLGCTSGWYARQDWTGVPLQSAAA